jgi:hypothetical protein
MECDAGQDEGVTNVIYRHNIHNTQKGNPNADCSQSVCKYPNSLPRPQSYLYVVELQVKFKRRVLLTLDLQITGLGVYFECPQASLNT